MIALDRIALRSGIEADLPPELRGVARDEVRLLVTDRGRRRHADRIFTQIPQVLRRGDLLVANDSATLPAALDARRADGSTLPLHFSAELEPGRWIVEPRGPVSAGDVLALPRGARALLREPRDAAAPRLWTACIEAREPVLALLTNAGRPIRYRYVDRELPLAMYQTIFARRPGSAEMPSAGRPFTRRVLDALDAAGVEVATVTLHCGVASAERGEPPAPERFAVTADAVAAVAAARGRGGRVIAVGTTVVRALETAAHGGTLRPARGWTSHVVTPATPPRAVDGLLTGFHEPAASHVELLRAFADDVLLAHAYERAAAAGYRWHEFGDVHLIL